MKTQCMSRHMTDRKGLFRIGAEHANSLLLPLQLLIRASVACRVGAKRAFTLVDLQASTCNTTRLEGYRVACMCRGIVHTWCRLACV